MVRFVVLGAGLAVSTSASASAVAGCRYTGEVVAVSAETVEFLVTAAAPFGHSGPPAMCVDVGQRLSFDATASEQSTVGGAVGDIVQAEVIDVWSRGHHSHVERFDWVPPAADLPE